MGWRETAREILSIRLASDSGWPPAYQAHAEKLRAVLEEALAEGAGQDDRLMDAKLLRQLGMAQIKRHYDAAWDDETYEPTELKRRTT